MKFRECILFIFVLFFLYPSSYAQAPVPEKKELSFSEKMKLKAAEAAEKAKKAAAAAAEKAKAAAAKAAAEAKVKAELMAKLGKQAIEEFKKIPTVFAERIKTLSFNTTMFDLTFPIKVEVPPTPPAAGTTSAPEVKAKTLEATLGIKYPLFAGYGDISAGFERVEGVFFPETIPGPLPLPSSLILMPLKSAPGVGDLLKKVMSLSPQTVFLLKVMALANDAQKMPAADAALFITTNLNFLLARLLQTPGVKGISDLFAVLPDFLEGVIKDILNKIELSISAQEIQEFNDRKGKPITEMQKTTSLIRWTLGYNARLSLAREKMLPLITSDLHQSDRALLLYHVKRMTYDLDKGFFPDDPDEGVRQIIERRVDDLVNFLDAVIEHAKEAQFNEAQQAEIKNIRDLAQGVKTSRIVPMNRPEFGGSETKKVPLLTYLDIKLYILGRDVLQRKFEEDGDFHEGKGDYLFDDSYLNKDQSERYMMAVLFRCLKERKNPKFDFASFLGDELGSFLFVRADERYRKDLLKIMQPFLEIFNSIQGIAQAAKKAAVSVADQAGAGEMVEGVAAGVSGTVGNGIFGMALSARQDALDEEADSLLDEKDFKILGYELDGSEDVSSEAEVPTEESVASE